MPAKKEQETWVDALRVFMRDEFGKNWTIVEDKGRARMGVRFSDGTRKYKYLPYEWKRKNANEIRHFIEAIYFSHIKKKVPFEEAFQRAKNHAPKPKEGPRRGVSKDQILEAWEKWGEFKLKIDGTIEQSTWDRGFIKTKRVLMKCTDFEDAHGLLTNVSKFHDPGIRTRVENVERVASFLRWACSDLGKNLLDKDIYSPPPKNNLGDYKGKKSRKYQEETQQRNPIDDDLIFKLLETLEPSHPNMKGKKRESARGWGYCLRLMTVYGLRPIETRNLELRKQNGKTKVWCTYCKRSVGLGVPRELFPIHEELEEEWNLIERIGNGETLPKAKEGVGEGLKNYFKNNDYWLEIKEKHDLVFYSFRHRWATLSHSDYFMSVEESSQFMGHKPETHMTNYSHILKGQKLEDVSERAKKRRRREKESE